MRILILSPHTDDGQFGCGGTAAKLICEMHEVHEFVFSFAEDAVLGPEWRAAMAALGIIEAGYMSVPPRHFPAHRQEILERMYAMRDGWDRVLCPSSFDTHQDHEVVRQEAFRAFKHTASIWGYEIPWNCTDFTANHYGRLTDEDMVAKRQSIDCYKSQQRRGYASLQFIDAWGRYHGVRAQCKYAEAFETIKTIE